MVSVANDDGFGNIAPVGSYPEGISWIGAFDMSGNVWDWVSTLPEAYPYDGEDGRESTDDRSTDRARRGGSFTDAFAGLHSANRNSTNPNSQDNQNGFRCARSYD